MRQALLLFFTAWLMGACNAYYYAPNTLHTPYLRQRHDAQISVGGLSGVEFTGFEIHASYALTNRMAVMVNHVQLGNGSSNSDRRGEGRLIEGALGLYYPFGENASNHLLAGWGLGQVAHYYNRSLGSRLHFHRYFAQYGLVAQVSALRIGVPIRLSYLKYQGGLIVPRQITNESDLLKIERIEEEPGFLFFEAGLSLGVGGDPIYVNAFVNSASIKRAEEFGFAHSTIGISATLQLGQLLRH